MNERTKRELNSRSFKIKPIRWMDTTRVVEDRVQNAHLSGTLTPGECNAWAVNQKKKRNETLIILQRKKKTV